MRTPLIPRLVVYGVGLIGGSLAAALKARGAARRVIGVGRSYEHTFATQADVTGQSSVVVRVTAAADADSANDEAATGIAGTIVVTPGTPVVEGFEAGNGGWSGTGTWAHGTPTGSFMMRAGEGSFAWSLYESTNSPTWAYFSTFSRAWELGIGALIAVFAGSLQRIPDAIRPVLAWLGLAATRPVLTRAATTTAG